MGGIPDLDTEKEPATQLKSSWCRRPEAAVGWSCTALIEQQDSVARISGHGESGSKGLGRGRSQGLCWSVRSSGIMQSLWRF